ncbi:MAG: DNA polymerase I [Bacteroidaceae bacterium]
MKKLYLLDAYALIYRAYYAFIKNPRINSRGENTSAVLGFVNTLEEVIQKEQPSHLGVAFDPSGGTFRHEAFPQYKAQREETPEAIRLAVPYIKQILEAYHIPRLEVKGFEADDVIGTLARQAGEQGIDTIMMTPDKDYGQLVTDHIHMLKPALGKSEPVLMGPAEVNAKWGLQNPLQVIDMLALMGDASDNIPGCPGVGEKTAARLIQEYGSVENLLANTHTLKGALKLKVEENAEQIRTSHWLATIRTDVPITLDMDSLLLVEPDYDQLQDIYERLEFRTLMRRKMANVPRTPGEKPKSQGGYVQGDMFATESQPAPESSLQGDLFADTAPSCRMTTWKDSGARYILADTPEGRAQLIARLSQASELCIDTETTSTDPMQATLVGMSFAVREGEAWYVPVGDDPCGVAEEFRAVLENPGTLKIGQNMKYDLQVLRSCGIRLAGPMFDTMIAHYLLHPEMRHGMDYLAEAYLNYQTIHIDTLIGSGKKQISMAQVPPQDVCPYAAEDADITLRLKNLFQPQLEEAGCMPLFHDLEMPLMPVLAQMERNGVCIDSSGLRDTSVHYTEEMAILEREIHKLAGLEFNVSSPRQVGEVLFDRLHLSSKAKKTKNGQYTTSEEVLEGLRQKHPIVEKILQYRGLKKLLSTYIDALPLLVNPRTGHIHTSFNQTVTATGRLSSSNPNLQNIPVRDALGKEVRKAFVPDTGELFFSADYSQIELRIMAHLSQDANLIEAFSHGDDIHAATAAKIFHKGIKDVTADERRKAKTANFGIIYGISAFGLAERMGVSRTEAKQLIDGYFATYPGVRQYMTQSIETAREKGYTETLCQRRCYLPDINSNNAVVRGYAERNAINAPIQGSAADIIKRAMIRIQKRLEEEGMRSKMILQVHDELNFSVPPEEKERLQALVIEEMQGAYELRVPLVADCGWGNNWLEAH